MESTSSHRQKDLVFDFVRHYYKKPRRSPYSFHEMGSKAMNYGVVCFGKNKKDCLVRFGKGPLLSRTLPGNYKLQLDYIAYIDVMLFIGMLFYYFFGNPVFFLFYFIAMIYFFVY